MRRLLAFDFRSGGTPGLEDEPTVRTRCPGRGGHGDGGEWVRDAEGCDELRRGA